MLEGWILCFYCWRCLLLVIIQQVSLSLLLFVLETHFSHGSFWGKPLKLACLAQSRALLTPASRGSAFTNSTENPPPSQLLVFNELGCTAWKCSSAECCDGFRKTTEGEKKSLIGFYQVISQSSNTSANYCYWWQVELLKHNAAFRFKKKNDYIYKK